MRKQLFIKQQLFCLNLGLKRLSTDVEGYRLNSETDVIFALYRQGRKWEIYATWDVQGTEDGGEEKLQRENCWASHTSGSLRTQPGDFKWSPSTSFWKARQREGWEQGWLKERTPHQSGRMHTAEHCLGTETIERGEEQVSGQKHLGSYDLIQDHLPAFTQRQPCLTDLI